MPSFQEITDNPHILEHANWTLLELLLAYDASNDKAQKLLKAAKQFAEWIQSEEPNDIHLINLLQTIKRERELSKGEKRDLFIIIENKEQLEPVLVAAHLLLGNETVAEMHFEHLDEEEKSNFRTWPIFRFWEAGV